LLVKNPTDVCDGHSGDDSGRALTTQSSAINCLTDSISKSPALGAVASKIWRVGLMGYCSQKVNVLVFLAAFEKVLLDQVCACQAARVSERRFEVTPKWRRQPLSADRE